VPASATCVGIPVSTDGDVPKELGLDRSALSAARFEGKTGQTLTVPRTKGPMLVAVGVGPRAEIDGARLRDAAAAFARAAEGHEQIALLLGDTGLSPQLAAQAMAEGAVLARYHYLLRGANPTPTPLRELALVGGAKDDIDKGIGQAAVTTRAAELARDL